MNKKLFLILVFVSAKITAQYNGNDFFVSVNYIYTTTSKLYLQPYSSDPVLRGSHDDLDGIDSYSAEFGYRIYREIVVAFSVEHMEKTYTNNNMALGGIRVNMKDGYKVLMFAFSVYYTLPFSTEYFKFFMGGGGGFYFGDQVRKLGDVTASTVTRKVGYGIQVAVGMDYLLTSQFAVRGQMRFRDPEFEMKSKYTNNIVNYGDRTFLLSTNTFNSKVNVDGMSFVIGMVFQF